MKRPELLVPASSLEVLKVAVIYGADAVYIGGEAFGLRAKAKNFSKEDMCEGIAFAHSHGVKVYVTVNILAHNRDLEGVREYLAKHNTQIMSWGPFAEGKNDFFNTPVLKEIGAKYGKSVAQVALRFLLQNGVVVIPKSTHEERMQENFNVFDFVLTDEEMKQIEVLDTGKSLFFSHYSPETVEWFMSIV